MDITLWNKQSSQSSATSNFINSNPVTQEHDEFVTTKGNGNVAMYALKNWTSCD